eukprot:48924_1
MPLFGNAPLAVIHKQLFNCKFTSKTFVRESKKCSKNVKQNKKKCKRAMEKGNTEGATIWAENAIREHAKSQKYLTASSRIDGIVRRLTHAIQSNQLSESLAKTLAKTLNEFNSVVETRDVDKVIAWLDKYESQYEDLDLRNQYMESAMSSSAMSAPQVQSLMSSIADGCGLGTDTIGLAVGGSRDIGSFRQCIQQNVMPPVGSITYNGLLYEYYFDTTTRKYHDNQEQKECKDSEMFYPTYCFARTNDEYYMTLGLNSNIKQDAFKRKHLNLVIVLDQSGSMSSTFGDGSRKTKMQVANESVCALLHHLTAKDRFGLITFESNAQIIQKLGFVGDNDMDVVKEKILGIEEGGGTNFSGGFSKAVDLFDALFEDNEYLLNCVHQDYENRIIFLTDAQPNISTTNPTSLLAMVAKSASDNQHRIYTTFIGIGLDFQASLIQHISRTRGCNYYSVQSSEAFMNRMDNEFEFMVTPLVFNVSLRLNAEGDACGIDKIYGSASATDNEHNIITQIDTLFPSRKIGGKTKGGVQLIKLKRNDLNKSDHINVEIEVRFEDRNNKEHVNKQVVTFDTQSVAANDDMIENDEDMNVFYDNLGIRKAILLVKYVELMMQWIDENDGSVCVDDKYKKLFEDCLDKFQAEMKICNDKDLQKEIDIITTLLNPATQLTVKSTGNDQNEDLEARLRKLQGI